MGCGTSSWNPPRWGRAPSPHPFLCPVLPEHPAVLAHPMAVGPRCPHLLPTRPHNPGGAQIQGRNPSPDPPEVRGCPMSVSQCGRGAFTLPRLSLCAPGPRHRQPGEAQALSLSLSLSLSCRMGAEHGQDRPCSRRGPTQPTHSSPPLCSGPSRGSGRASAPRPARRWDGAAIGSGGER